MKSSKKIPSAPITVLRPFLPVVCLAGASAIWAGWVLHACYSQGHRLHLVYWQELFDFMGYIPHVLKIGLAWDMVLVAALWSLFIGIGNRLFRALGIDEKPNVENALLSAGLGAGTTSLVLLIVGLCGFWQPAILCWGFVAGLAYSLWSGIRWINGSRQARNQSAAARKDWWSLCVLGVLVIAVVVSVVSTAAPDIFFDSLVYHLALPKLYLLRGRIVPTPENLYSGIPFGMEMLYGLTLSLADEKLSALLHCTFSLATAAVVWAWLRRQAGAAAGILGAALFLLCPAVLFIGLQSGVDLTASFYVILAFCALARGLESAEMRQQRSWALATGFFLGFAMGIKYTVAPLCGAFVLTQFWLGSRQGQQSRRTLEMATMACAVFSPWLLKNILFYGNPVYPFLHGLFGNSAPADWAGFLSDARSRDLLATGGSISGWKNLIAQSWLVSVAAGMISDWFGPTFLILMPAIAALRWGIIKRSPDSPVVWTAAVVLATAGYGAWLLTSALPRFLIPALPLMACAAALAVERGALPHWLRRMWWGIVLIVSLYNLQSIVKSGGLAMGKWAVLRGRQSPTDYLETQHSNYGAPYYAAMEFVNQQLPESAKILFLGESRSFYCERDHVAATVFDRNPFWTAVSEAPDAAGVRDRLKAAGITHIFLNVNELYANAAHPPVLPRDLAAGPKFGEFWGRYLHKVYEKKETTPAGNVLGWLVVYKLLDVPNSDSMSLRENPIWDILKETSIRESGRPML